ncbi:tetratricopeptide repeat protein [Bradyrhizobium sp. 168]|uniref:tetratricopeptide repeat protein n=1 Tax=Bradyrhizobium sp. 168 TaxID=2782639 RepID=UPI001FF93CBF|nr:tetratricopeptide repeat protein [Bradyrhizobium sp. 168]
MWNWLTGSKDAPRDDADEEEFDLGNTIHIASHDFIGLRARSPNGRFTLAWADGGPDQSRIGRYLLLDGKRVIVEGRMPRPNDGVVTDGGVFILNDWGASETLSGTFHAFDVNGKTLVSRRFMANLFNNGVSADGHFAACQTANAPGADGNRLTVFDLQVGREIGGFQPESGWAKNYAFFPETRHIRLLYHDGGAFDYDFGGAFVDRMKWLAFGLMQGNIFVIETLIAEMDGKLSPELANQVLPAIDIALGKLRADDNRTRARLLRSRGTCLEALADLREALACYDEALSLDPKVGVKRRADALRKVV